MEDFKEIISEVKSVFKVDEYQIAYGLNKVELANAVNAALPSGWLPLGGAFIGVDGDLCQAMVRY